MVKEGRNHIMVDWKAPPENPQSLPATHWTKMGRYRFFFTIETPDRVRPILTKSLDTVTSLS